MNDSFIEARNAVASAAHALPKLGAAEVRRCASESGLQREVLARLLISQLADDDAILASMCGDAIRACDRPADMCRELITHGPPSRATAVALQRVFAYLFPTHPLVALTSQLSVSRIFGPIRTKDGFTLWSWDENINLNKAPAILVLISDPVSGAARVTGSRRTGRQLTILVENIDLIAKNDDVVLPPMLLIAQVQRHP